MSISIIVAVAKNGVIGRDGDLPWHISADLRRFKALTMGHPIVMGRKTYDSIGRPLPGRRNVVVTRNPDWSAEGVEAFTTLEDALAATADEDPYIIGGAQIYALALSLANRIELTEVLAEVAGDTHFPDIDKAGWHETASEQHDGEGDEPPYRFVTLERV